MNAIVPPIETQRELVLKLRERVFRSPDPSASADLLANLAQAEKLLKELEPTAATVATQPPTGTQFLGQRTTGLTVSTDLHMQPIPTGIYHLLDPAEMPLVSINIKNHTTGARRLRTTVYLEGLSAQAVCTREVAGNGKVTISMFPTLLPERIRQLSEVQWVTLHVIVDILPSVSASSDKQILAEIRESHDTFVVLCLSRNSGLNSMFDHKIKEWIDLRKYYGAWVTPYEPTVQRCLRQAADLDRKVIMQGYQGNRASVTAQVSAIFNALKAIQLMYINSVLDYGMSTKHATQRTRLPRESLAQQSANCLDGTVLMASLLEGASLNPVLAFVPGHAFLGWEPVEGSDEYEFVETTMIGTHAFEAACVAAKKLATQYDLLNLLQTYPLHRLRKEGIYPME